jgi:small subunit ribosomal protein S6
MEKIIHNYELVLLSPAGATEDILNASFNKLNQTIEEFGGALLIKDDWGTLRTQYPINKKSVAKYFLLEFTGPAELPIELERLVRIDNTFIRFLTVRIKENVTDVEGLRAEAASRALLRKEKITSLKQENV